MPGLAKKLLICAAVDGLFLHAVGSGREKEAGLRIAYGSNNSITSAPPNNHVEHTPRKEFEAYGIFGLLDLVKTSYLIAISQRDQVAQIRGKAVYGVRDVILIPLSSQADAAKAIASAQRTSGGTADGEESEVESDDESPVGGDEASPAPKSSTEGSSVVRNIVQDRGKYGRFAERWFSKGGGWNASGRRQQGMSGHDDEDLTKEQAQQAVEALPGDVHQPATESSEGAKSPTAIDHGDAAATRNTPAPTRSAIETLTPRIIRAARLYFSSSGFYFSYDHDISRSLIQKDSTISSTPLWKRFDLLFFWNRHLVSPFVNTGNDNFVLPVLQGFVCQRSFSIARTEGQEPDLIAQVSSAPAEGLSAQESLEAETDKEDPGRENLLLTLISRRSINRAGLRYLRRGIDEDGNVANTVETEQVLSSQTWDATKKSFSLVQLRGSIPLFFSQNPYSFKPMPVFFGSDATNQTAFKKHFTAVAKRYGSTVEAASLIDRHGNELAIGEAYERHAELLNEEGGIEGRNIGFEWFDFHGACKGMKFENVSLLIDKLGASLQQIGWSVGEDDKIVIRQSGVLRANCMDCLDRTNVVQSAIGGWALQKQLTELGLSIDLQADPKTQWFNVLWADNGDAISKQYAGTSALKGDFTRTRKRHWTGALSDFSLTLNRYYNNLTSDYLLQTNIDYWLGNTGPQAFDEFVSDMANADHRIDIGRIRQNAIDTCSKMVLEDPHEDLLAGWTLSCPHEANTLRTLPFEECILLLTDAALYFCRFDWDTDKVGSFERVALPDLTALWKGAYITSTLGATHTDPARNVGLALRYRTAGAAVVRTNTRSIQNEHAAQDENANQTELDKQQQPEKSETRLLAFKALPATASATRRSADTHGDLGDEELVQHICDEIIKALKGKVELEERDIISVAEARRNTGFVEAIGYNLKKLVWS